MARDGGAHCERHHGVRSRMLRSSSCAPTTGGWLQCCSAGSQPNSCRRGASWPLRAAGLNIHAARYWMQQLHPKVRCTKLSLPWSEGWYSWTWWISLPCVSAHDSARLAAGCCAGAGAPPSLLILSADLDGRIVPRGLRLLSAASAAASASAGGTATMPGGSGGRAAASAAGTSSNGDGGGRCEDSMRCTCGCAAGCSAAAPAVCAGTAGGATSAIGAAAATARALSR